MIVCKIPYSVLVVDTAYASIAQYYANPLSLTENLEIA